MRAATAAAQAVLVAVVGGGGRPSQAASPPGVHRVSVDARGPLALVDVTRAVAPRRDERGGDEALLDIALPDESVMVEVEVKDGARWRRFGDKPGKADADLYRSESAARGVMPAAEPFEQGTTHRLRVTRSAPGSRGAPEPTTIRYRFACIPQFSNGRYWIRFPQPPERLPVPASVSVAALDADDVDIAGARTRLPRSGAGMAAGKATGTAPWSISWAPRATSSGAPRPKLAVRLAVAAVSRSDTAVAFSLRNAPGKPADPPASALLVIDRSKSVGLAGLSAERDLARRVLESLPPSTRFNVVFFDRRTKLLFPATRPATREALEALEAEMVPDQMQNGTDLAAAVRRAATLLRQERQTGTTAGPALLAIITDGAITDEHALERCDSELPPGAVTMAAFVVRPAEDEAMGEPARKALRALTANHAGILRELRTQDISDVAPAALADLARGGDVTTVQLTAGGGAPPRTLADVLPPATAAGGVALVGGSARGPFTVGAIAGGRRIAVTTPPATVAPEWVRAWLRPVARQPAVLVSPSMVALLEPIVAAPESAPEPAVAGSLDRVVVRNVLSLAYMPRARACYLGRSGASIASRDLTGRVRLAIDVVRGEVERATIASSTLGQPEIDRCLEEGAYAIDVPRPVRSDAPFTAILNLVFRPHAPDRPRPAETALDPHTSEQIDLMIEGAKETETRAKLDGGHD